MPVDISFFRGQSASGITLIAAACVIVVLPVVVAYGVLQRSHLKGATFAALKE